MQFSSEQFVNRLNTLEDSQESIANGSKWLLSQYKYTDDIMTVWQDYMLNKNNNTRRKLMSVYLINHVVQESKRKKIVNFYGNDKFGSSVINVINKIYFTLPSDLKKKVKRVLTIWKDRKIFSNVVLQDIDSSIFQESEEVPNKTGKQTSSIDSTSESSKNKFEQTLSANLRELASKETELVKTTQSVNASYLRFKDIMKTNSRDNLNAIGDSTKLLIESNITIRTLKRDILNKLLEENDKLIEDEQNLLGEIDMILHSNTISNDQNYNNDNDDVLPTYEDNKDESDSDSDISTDGKGNGGDKITSNESTMQKRTSELSATDDSEIDTQRKNQKAQMNLLSILREMDRITVVVSRVMIMLIHQTTIKILSRRVFKIY
ncbi:hypothetical protein TPHA_0D01790 [Tetrapisispora phaffii CBS 4417]|uniref:CID domain-containing protein n=1 Tax=Tetrapisispora phaffii (strain ATCC 24235 / CBS 4417 / NBRC 1672 / NRRL Y-8282 / UCD 70-5) TaxID=1071381 RepID=G8BSJ7_TETPH|nr:hypothetical protein TPHA_0D01790 [Tetrapisispora phaffii CBS 4417]CCE62818.1 hypothetical protein TPHA_0D01790 [Tetrapisispora phaffii CBS 4417]